MEQPTAWSVLGVFFIFATIFASIPIALAFFLRPRKPHAIKEETYECGLNPHGSPWLQFNIQYYLFALVFLIFDIEILYVYPWALNFKSLGWVASVEMFVFLGILTVGLVYAWKKGALEWK